MSVVVVDICIYAPMYTLLPSWLICIVFIQHMSLLHVVEGRTFETEEIVCMPNCDPPSSLARSTIRPRSTDRDPPSPTATHLPLQWRARRDIPHPPPPSSVIMFVGPTRFRLLDDDLDGIVVIPPLGDCEVEADV